MHVSAELVERKSIGQQIREARLSAGLSQEDIGDLIGKCRQMVRQYEEGSAPISADALAKIAIRLGMSEVNVNGHRFVIQQRDEGEATETAEQLRLDFDKEHVFEGAVLKTTATKTTISITATAPTLRPAP